MELVRAIESNKMIYRDFIQICNSELQRDKAYKSTYSIILSDPKQLVKLCAIEKKWQENDAWGD